VAEQLSVRGEKLRRLTPLGSGCRWRSSS